jgi:hypothetical protein
MVTFIDKVSYLHPRRFEACICGVGEGNIDGLHCLHWFCFAGGCLGEDKVFL